MGVEYQPAIDMFIDSPAWVFTDALAGLPGSELSIVLHKTASGGFQTATEVAQYFINDVATHKSVHFIVGRDGSVIQVVHLKDGAGGNCCLESGHDTYWTSFQQKYGNLNRCTISIEHEDWTVLNTQAMTPEQIDASFKLVHWLVNKFNVPVSHIKGHNTLDPISKAHCPGSTYPMSELINSFSSSSPTPPPVDTPDYQLQASIAEWKSIVADIPMNTGIYDAWLSDYRSGIFRGPPLSDEYETVNWNGQPIKVQQFTRYRCEDNGGKKDWL